MSDWIRREAENYKAAQEAGAQKAEHDKRRFEALVTAWPLFWNAVVGHIEGDVAAWNEAFPEQADLHLRVDRASDTGIRILGSRDRRLTLVATDAGISGTTMRRDPNGNAHDIELPMMDWNFDGNRVSGVKNEKGVLAAPGVSELILRMFLPKT